jgi:hypothetical protein
LSYTPAFLSWPAIGSGVAALDPQRARDGAGFSFFCLFIFYLPSYFRDS